ncbi:hypothetical protein MMC30_004070 [Trapelia coarctata]|nr:hypothetical protein [Trapelia coarctata]
MDAANVAWKIGLCALNLAQLPSLGPSYDQKRRLHAICIIRVFGSYLRFVCNSEFPLASFDTATADLANLPDAIPYTPGQDLEFIREFFGKNGHFLLGVDAPYQPNIVSPLGRGGQPSGPPRSTLKSSPRISKGPVAEALAKVSTIFSSPGSFYHTYGGRNRSNVVLITKCQEHEAAPLLTSLPTLAVLRDHCQILYDDRRPDEDAHTCYEVDHARGALVVVRPDLWVGQTAFLDESEVVLEKYFSAWLLPGSKE